MDTSGKTYSPFRRASYPQVRADNAPLPDTKDWIALTPEAESSISGRKSEPATPTRRSFSALFTTPLRKLHDYRISSGTSTTSSDSASPVSSSGTSSGTSPGTSRHPSPDTPPRGTPDSKGEPFRAGHADRFRHVDGADEIAKTLCLNLSKPCREQLRGQLGKLHASCLGSEDGPDLQLAAPDGKGGYERIVLSLQPVREQYRRNVTTRGLQAHEDFMIDARDYLDAELHSDQTSGTPLPPDADPVAVAHKMLAEHLNSLGKEAVDALGQSLNMFETATTGTAIDGAYTRLRQTLARTLTDVCERVQQQLFTSVMKPLLDAIVARIDSGAPATATLATPVPSRSGTWATGRTRQGRSISSRVISQPGPRAQVVTQDGKSTPPELPDLAVALRHPGLRAAFAQFTRTEHSGENLAFLDAVDRYASAPTKAAALHIYRTYIEEDTRGFDDLGTDEAGPAGINLGTKNRVALRVHFNTDAFAALTDDAPQQADLFSAAKAEITGLLTDPYGRFKTSPAGTAAAHQYQPTQPTQPTAPAV